MLYKKDSVKDIKDSVKDMKDSVKDLKDSIQDEYTRMLGRGTAKDLVRGSSLATPLRLETTSVSGENPAK